MNLIDRLGIGPRIGLFAGAGMVLLAILLLVGYSYRANQSTVQSEVKAARQLVLMAESVRQETARKWDLGIFSPEKLRQWKEEAASDEAAKEKILNAVPVVTAWRAAQAKADQGNFDFKPLSKNPRNDDHAPDTTEGKAIDYFERNPNANEYYVVDEEMNAVRYFRPIRYTESCLACHGEPSRSQELWGRDDGRDILGYKMEGVDKGDLKGAFEIIRPLDKAQAALSSNLWTAGITALLVVGLLVVTMLWFVQRRISRPLNDTINKLQHISESGDLTARVPEARVPEMGRLSRTFNEFVTGLAGTFKDYRNQTSQLASSSEELSATAEEISQNAQSSSQRVEQVSSSAQEVNEVVQDVANNIQTVSDAAGKSSQSTQEGKQAVDQAAQRLDQLKASSDRVDEIIATIQNIAKKTDLLALNAAIEAANAGEQGKGFAVVADEVRKLAEQTSQATTQVNDIISEVRQHSDSSVEAMNQVQSKMDEVLSNIENTDQTANQIAAAAEELAATMSETTDNMGEIAGSTDQVADSVVQIQDAAQQLGDLANDLQHSLELYRLDQSEGSGGTMFRKAKSDHLAWRTKLRDMLNGKATLTEQEATSHEKCRFGQWIYGEGKQKYGQMKEFQDIEGTHKSLHQSIKKVIQLRNQGKKEDANKEFARFQELSETLINELDTLANKVG